MNQKNPPLEKVERFILENRLISPGDNVLVSCSGGPDSVSCLHMLNSIGQKHRFSVFAGHFNHRLRVTESDEDESYCKKIAAQWNIPFCTGSEDTKTFCRKNGLSLQDGARRLRYAFLEDTAKNVCASKIAVAHNMQDNVETFLMHLIRGSGMTGLMGIPYVNNRIIRPLITTSKDEIIEYLRRNNIQYRTDSSNQNIKYLRNDIRHTLISTLLRYNLNFMDSATRLMDILKEDDELVSSYIDNIWDEVLVAGPEDAETADKITLDAQKLSGFPVAATRRVIRKAISTLKGNLLALSYRHINDIRRLISENKTGKMLHLPGKIKARYQYGLLILEKSVHHRICAKPVQATQLAFEVKPPVSILKEFGIKLSFETAGMCDMFKNRFADDKNMAVFDLDKVSFPAIVRNYREGDVFFPHGMHGKKKKLSRLFIDKKIIQEKRKDIPVFTTDGKIAWVVGVRQDERFTPGEDTRQVLIITVSWL